jgi:2-phosphoglycerate kinase
MAKGGEENAVPHMREDVMQKSIILVGGTAGTGKSTLARELSSLLGIDHRLGTGFIREVLRSETSSAKDPDLFTFTFRSENPIKTLIAQAKRLRPAILSCMRRARQEGTSLIIEGNHLLPELYCDAGADLSIILSAPQLDEHLRRLQGPSHINRTISTDDFKHAVMINEYFRTEAGKCGLPFLLYENNLTNFVNLATEGQFIPG